MTLYSTEEAAEKAGVTRQTVWVWCVSGKLPAQKVGRTYAIKARDLSEFLLERDSNAENINVFDSETA